jgi:DNA-binding NarL/FixJ family response regulator
VGGDGLEVTVRTPVRILVVEDFAGWRDFIRAELGKDPEIEIVAELSDGRRAVQEAERLQPDLIVLDIGLPTLNGIEAAKCIRECTPEAKILFVSENRSPEVIEEALRTGAGGYVVKTDAKKELLAAFKAVLAGKRFLSASLAGQFLLETSLSAQTMTLSWIIAVISGIR